MRTRLFAGGRAMLPRRLNGASVIALAIAAPSAAWAQAADAPHAVDEVVITGSRAITNGANAPTPVTVVSAAQLRQAAPTGVADALNQLPVLQNSLRPSSTGSSATGAAGNGANLLSLRGLGSQRTLVLLDGRRLTPSNTAGSTDVNLIPQALLSRVDIVTGGASAAYGSDAVAGVVNFILDTKFTGLKGEVQGGISSRSDNGSGKFGLTWGQSFLDGRAHLLASVDGYHNEGIGLDYNGRTWAEAGWGLIPTGGTPSNTFAPNVRFSTATFGGLITSGPLANMMFLPGGALAPFQVGSFRSATVMSGGDGAPGRTNLVPSLTTQTAYTYGEFELTPKMTVFGSASFGQVTTKYPAITGGRQQGTEAYTIFNDNAFLPDAVRTRMQQLGITQFTMGRFGADWGPVDIRTFTATWDLTGGVKGSFGDNWQYSAYYEHGRSIAKVLTSGNPYFDHMYRAADAVRNPATGQIVCRTSLANPGEGCVPINLFGDGAPSAAAIAYVTGTASSRLVTTQDVAAFDVRGEPFSLWAGPLALAFGAEYRKDAANQIVDAVSASKKAANGVRGFPTSAVGGLGGFQQSNPQPIDGDFSIKEGFVEIDAPLAKDMAFVHALNLNAAIRYADYSTAGGATTWKLGLTYSPVEDLRLRITQSRDIRAPNIGELFTGSQQTNGVGVRDPRFGGATTVVVQQTTGNVDLVPEKADTFTGGIVYQPSWLPGASFSADFYKIDISRVITPLSAQQVVDGCQAGNAELCSFVQRNAPVAPATVGTINSVRTPTFNLDARNTQGIDFEASYHTAMETLFPGASGQIGIRALATYIDKLVTVTAGVPVDRAGDVGGTALSGAPHWQGLVAVTYDNGPFALFAQGRYMGGGKFDSTLTPALLAPAQNHVRDVLYVDLSARYKFEVRGVNYEAYGTINNLFDQDPPLTPNGAVTTPRSANGNRYDFVGRYYVAGLRFKF
jgi:iron complex outermembrane receptor protein